MDMLMDGKYQTMYAVYDCRVYDCRVVTRVMKNLLWVRRRKMKAEVL